MTTTNETNQQYKLDVHKSTSSIVRHATPILSWVPHQRQFAALCALASLPPQRLQLLLSPAAVPKQPPRPLSSLLPAPMAIELQRRFNASQQQALAAVAAAGAGTTAAARVVLVQGPPGTGKTAAICGMLSALLIQDTPPPASVNQPPCHRGAHPAAIQHLVRASAFCGVRK